jgi:hypothetical protein
MYIVNNKHTGNNLKTGKTIDKVSNFYVIYIYEKYSLLFMDKMLKTDYLRFGNLGHLSR